MVEILKRFRMMDCKAIVTPMASKMNFICDHTSERFDGTIYSYMIVSLIHLMKTIPNIFFVVNTWSQYMLELRHVQVIAENHVLRHLKGRIEYGLRYVRDQRIYLQGNIDSNWDGSATYRRALYDATSACSLAWFIGSARNKQVYHWLQLRNNIFYLVQQH